MISKYYFSFPSNNTVGMGQKRRKKERNHFAYIVVLPLFFSLRVQRSLNDRALAKRGIRHAF